ncbi:hypothetical protein MMC14_009952 [Varicellaria rhodocarpa]|nr:hypothetical protein [Varicellaria rhodocarpa]
MVLSPTFASDLPVIRGPRIPNYPGTGYSLAPGRRRSSYRRTRHPEWRFWTMVNGIGTIFMKQPEPQGQPEAFIAHVVTESASASTRAKETAPPTSETLRELKNPREV